MIKLRGPFSIEFFELLIETKTVISYEAAFPIRDYVIVKKVSKDPNRIRIDTMATSRTTLHTSMDGSGYDYIQTFRYIELHSTAGVFDSPLFRLIHG